MNKITKCVFVAAVALAVLSIAATNEYRAENKPVARYEFAQLDWVTSEGHDAQTSTINNVNGMIERIDILVSSVTDDPNVSISWADQNSVVLLPAMADLDDGTKHIKKAYSFKATADGDFDPVPHNGNITMTADPSADAGGTSQTLTVDVIMYVR